jgi:hypothetical protein
MDALDTSTLGVKFKSDLDHVRSALDALKNTRGGADRFDMSAQETSAFYTGTIGHLVNRSIRSAT